MAHHPSSLWGSMGLTHWCRDKMDAISQTTLSNAFLWMKMLEFLIEMSLKFVPKGPINNIPALVQIMACRRPGDKPLSEPMMVCLPTHICLTRPQWVKAIYLCSLCPIPVSGWEYDMISALYIQTYIDSNLLITWWYFYPNTCKRYSIAGPWG